MGIKEKILKVSRGREKKVTTRLFHNTGRDEAMLSNCEGKMLSENLHPNCQLSINEEQRYFRCLLCVHTLLRSYQGTCTKGRRELIKKEIKWTSDGNLQVEVAQPVTSRRDAAEKMKLIKHPMHVSI